MDENKHDVCKTRIWNKNKTYASAIIDFSLIPFATFGISEIHPTVLWYLCSTKDT